MSSFEQAVSEARQLRDDRDWAQFHNPKDLAISISIEAGELLETFQWSGGDLERKAQRDRTKEELADVLIYCIYLADAIDADIPALIRDKIHIDNDKYPAEKARGNSRKYTDL